MVHPLTIQIKTVFTLKGNDNYGVEQVTQLQHACQCGSLALEAGMDDDIVISAFLHDIGHLLNEENFPSSLQANLDDHHEERGYNYLKQYFGAKITDPIRLHVAAKRYLCTIDSDYAKNLSPTSYQSFIDQGGIMSQQERTDFEKEPFFKEAVLVREWDDKAKVEGIEPFGVEFFLEKINQLLLE